MIIFYQIHNCQRCLYFNVPCFFENPASLVVGWILIDSGATMCRPTRFNDGCLRLLFSVVLAIALPLNAAMAQQNDFDPGSRDSLAVQQPLKRGRVDQVDPQNGNLLVRHIDLTMKGNGRLDIVVHRIYDMLSGSAGLNGRAYSDSYRWATLGAGWSLSAAPRYAEYKVQPTNGTSPHPTVLSELCRGQISSNFNLETSGFIEMPDGQRDQLVSVGGGRAVTKNNWKAECVANVLTVRSPQGLTYDFGDVSSPWRGQDGPPVMFALAYSVPARKVTDLSGNWISFEYRKVGAPTPFTGYSPSRITSSDGRQVDFTYNETSRRLVSMQDNTGRVWTYEHAPSDANSSAPTLLSVALPGNERWSYTYAPGPKFSSNAEENAKTAKLQTLTYPEGGTVTFEVENVPFNFIGYVGDQAQVRSKNRERVVRVTRSTGEQWTYTYQHGGAGQYDTTIETTPIGMVTYKFMGSGFVLPTRQGAAADNIWQLGHLMEKVDESGNQEIRTWARREMSAHPIQFDGAEQMNDTKIWAADLTEQKIVRDGATYITRFTGYDSYGNAASVTEIGPAGETRTTTRTFYVDSNKWIVNRVKDEMRAGDTTTRSFDGNGKLLTISRNGVTTSYTYDSEGNVATKTDPRSLVHTYGAYKRGVAQSEAQPESVSISRIVSDAGNIISETNGEGKTATYDHDGLDRVIRIGYPAGTATTISYGPNSKSLTRGALTENTVYDDFGRVASITLGGVARTFRHDALDRRTFESDPDSPTGTGYEFDNFNRVTRMHNADGSGQTISYSGSDKIVTDERNNVTTYRYRAFGDPSERYLMNVAAPEPSASIAIMRNESDLVSTVTQDGITRSYNYNSNHYLTSVINPETGTTTYGRDAAGNMTTRSVGGAGNTYYTYDGQNRLTAVTYPGRTPAVTKSYSKTHRIRSVVSAVASRAYLYDDNDNLTSETSTVDGLVFGLGYTYNGNDQLTSITYPRSGRVVNYAPDVLGRPTTVSGYVDNVTYWPSGLIRQIAYANGTTTSYGQHVRLWPASFSTWKGGVAFMDSTYAYDGAGNLTSIVDTVDASNNRTMVFDNINRLTGISGPWGGGALTYSGGGNITSQILGAHNLYYNYDSSNRLSSVSGARVTSYSYDSYGDIASGSGSTYNYDGVPNLICVSCNDSSLKIEYAYDGLNRRVSVAKGGLKTYEFYGSNGDQLVEYTPGQSGKLIEYIYLGGKRVAQRVTP